MRKSIIVITTLGLAGGPALADEPLPVTATFGVGATGFSDTQTRDFAQNGTTWDARLAFIASPWFELEAAYVGSYQNIAAVGIDEDTLLLGSGLEAALRVNLLPGAVQPYVFAGTGWMRYDLAFSGMNTSEDVANTDNVATFPMGLGVGYRAKGFLVDVRGTFRYAADADLIAPQATGNTDMHTWGAELRAGFEL